MDHFIDQLIDLTDPQSNTIHNMTLQQARALVLAGAPEAVRSIDGSFAIVAQSNKRVRLARSLDRPIRYFLAKRDAGPALIVAGRIDTIFQWLRTRGLADQFHPSYTRMVPAHYIVEIQLVGCPDPDPTYTRFFDPPRCGLPADLDKIGRAYVGELASEIQKWLSRIPQHEPIGVPFSGGADSGAVFLVTYQLLLKLGLNPGRLKAFTLSFGNGPDLEQARQFLEKLGLGLFLEPIEATPDSINVEEAIGVIEDYKPLDVECACMGLALCRGIRERYPDWKYLIDGDGGDENLKDYPVDENPELTIRSVINNPMLYQEGWGVGRMKHSLTYSGGLSRSYTRTYAPARRYGFEGFSPFTRPRLIETAEAIPFAELTQYDQHRLYGLKGEIISRGVQAITGMMMPIFPKRRFQHGALPLAVLRQRIGSREAEFRHQFFSLYE